MAVDRTGSDPGAGDSGAGPAPSARLQDLLHDTRQRLAGNRRQLERRVEEGVRAYLSRLKIPSREEIAALGAHLDGLEARVSTLERRRK